MVLVVQLLSPVWLFATPWTAAHQASLSFTISWSLFKLMSVDSVMPSSHFILYHPFLFLPSIFCSMRVFSNESAICIRWPKYWSFSTVLPINNLGWFPLGLTGLISLLSKEACHKDSRRREDSQDSNIWNKLLCFPLLLFPVWLLAAASQNQVLNNIFPSLNVM